MPRASAVMMESLLERVFTMDGPVDAYMPMQSSMYGLLVVWKLGERPQGQGWA